MNKLALLLASASLALGCAASSAEVDDEGDTEQAEGAASLTETSTYYTARRDTRRCVSPLCGGFWVRRVNESRTKCADGTWQSECYVAEIDWSSAGLDGTVQGDVLRGSISRVDFGGFGELGVFKLSEAWQAAVSGATASGSFYKVTDRVCAKAPCFDLTADKLNATKTRELTDLSGANGALATTAVSTEQIIAAGLVSSTPGGGRALSVKQFWLRIVAKPADSLACNVDSDCTLTAYNREVSSSTDCYCTTCPTTVMSTSSEDYYRTSWERSCSHVRLMCPLIMCVKPPAIACVSNQCVIASTPS